MLHVWDNLGYTRCCILTTESVIQFSAPSMGQSWLYSLLHSYPRICNPIHCSMYGTILVILFVAFLPQNLLSSSLLHVWDNFGYTLCCILTPESVIQFIAPCMGQSWLYSLLHSYPRICNPIHCSMYGTILVILFVVFLPQNLLSSSLLHVWDNLGYTLCCIPTTESVIQFTAPCMGQSWLYSLLHSNLRICNPIQCFSLTFP